MKIFRNNDSKNSTHPDTFGYNFGKTESEGEESYYNSTIFEDYLQVFPKINDGNFIIIGRKGSGKSAIAKYIKDNAVGSDSLFCEIIKTDVINLEKAIQESLTTVSSHNVSLFEWIILLKLVNMMLATQNGTYTSEIKAFRNFIRNNSGIADIEQLSVSEITSFSKLEINFGALLKESAPIFERRVGKRMEKAPYYRLLPALKEMVLKTLGYDVFKKYEFIVLFDDLDINFNSNSNEDKTYLLNLIRTAKELNNDLRRLNIENVQILIFLRDDIQRSLEGFASDTSKLFSSYKVELKWFENNKPRETDIALRRFINKRIINNFKRNGVPYKAEDAWCTLISNDESCYNGKTAFKYILDYTFYRPRDLIMFCNNIGSDRFYMPIRGANIKTLIQKYVTDNVKELKDELTIHFSQQQINDIFNILRELAPKTYDGFTKNEIISKLKANNLSEDAVDKLIEYSLIIPFDVKSGRLFIIYREMNYADYNIDSKCIKYKLHNCLNTFFNPSSLRINDNMED